MMLIVQSQLQRLLARDSSRNGRQRSDAVINAGPIANVNTRKQMPQRKSIADASGGEDDTQGVVCGFFVAKVFEKEIVARTGFAQIGAGAHRTVSERSPGEERNRSASSTASLRPEFSWMPSRYIAARTHHSRFPSTTCI